MRAIAENLASGEKIEVEISDDKLEEGKGFGDTMWEATGRAVLDALRE